MSNPNQPHYDVPPEPGDLEGILDEVLNLKIDLKSGVIDDLKLTAPTHRDEATLQYLIAYRLVLNAAGGDMKAIEHVMDRKMGKPKQYSESRHTEEHHNYLTFLGSIKEQEINQQDAPQLTARLVEQPKDDVLEGLFD